LCPESRQPSGVRAAVVLAAEAGVLTRARRMCRSLRWWRRLRGVRLFTLLGGGAHVVPRRLTDRNAEVRAAAVAWVADHADEALIRSVLRRLYDPHPLVRFVAKNTLLRIGSPAVEPLAAHLAVRGGERIDDAMDVAIGLAGPRLLAPVLRLAVNPSPRTRAGVATIAAAVGGKSAVGVVTGLLDDPDSRVRAAAVAGLGKLGHWPAAPRLVSALSDPAWDVRRAAGHSLRNLGGPGILLLRRALHSPDPFASDMARQVLDLPDAVRRQGSA
jgi:HEAT repeat protein